jgi:hypothetical protein
MHYVEDICGLSGLTGPTLQRLTEEIESAIRPWYTPAKEVFAGEFPTGCINAQVCVFPEGYLILINREIIQLLDDFVFMINALRLQFTLRGFSIIPKEEAFGTGFNDLFVKSVAAILLHHLHKLPKNESYTHFNRLIDWARARQVNNTSLGEFELLYRFQVLKACLSFIIAHEYGHIIADHLNPSRTARIRMAHGELTVAAKAIDEEREADSLANKVLESVLISRLMPYLDTPDFPLEGFIDGILVPAGPRLFLSIDAAIQHASSKVFGYVPQEKGSSHPPPEERLQQHDSFFKQFSDVLPQFFLLDEVYGSWLTPTLKAMPQAIEQLESGLASSGKCP